jgi:hypothetical protein
MTDPKSRKRKKKKSKSQPAQTTSQNTMVKTNPRRRRRRGGSGGTTTSRASILSPCALEYAMAVANPVSGPLACLPVWPSLLTRKFRVWCKGVGSTGTVGIGYLVMDPWQAIANDQNCVFYTDSTFTGNTIIQSGPGTFGAASNSDYPSVTFAPTAQSSQYRLTVALLRIRYDGTELNRGGQIISYSDPNHSSVVGMGPVDFLSNTECVRHPMRREWISLTYVTAQSPERDFQPYPPVGFGLSYSAGFLVVSTSPTIPVPFEWEAYYVFEATGKQIRGLSQSKADTPGFEHLNSSANEVTTRGSTLSDAQRLQSLLGKVVGGVKQISDTAKFAGDVASVLSPLYDLVKAST